MSFPTSPEAALEQWLDGPDLFLRKPRSPITKFKPENIQPKKRDSVIHLQQGKSPVYQEPQNHLSDKVQSDLDQLSNTLPLELRHLITLFVMHKGPQATILTIQHDQHLHPEVDYGKLNMTHYQYLVARATGTVCERMMYLSLKQQIQDGEKILLDLGSTTRFSAALTRASGVYIHPDGMLFSNIHTYPTLDTLYEYKNNSQRPDEQTSLLQQITHTREFFKAAKEQIFYIHTSADKVSRIRFNQIILAENPQIALVIPQDRQAPTGLGNDVTVIQAPFTSKLASSVASICIQPLFSPSAY